MPLPPSRRSAPPKPLSDLVAVQAADGVVYSCAIEGVAAVGSVDRSHRRILSLCEWGAPKRRLSRMWPVSSADGVASDLGLGAIRPLPSHRNIRTASPLVTPLSWMMPSTVRSASVFNCMKVLAPSVNQLIWPAAVNAAVEMKVKSWLPARFSLASMKVKWSTSPCVLL